MFSILNKTAIETGDSVSDESRYASLF